MLEYHLRRSADAEESLYTMDGRNKIDRITQYLVYRWHTFCFLEERQPRCSNTCVEQNCPRLWIANADIVHTQQNLCVTLGHHSQRASRNGLFNSPAIKGGLGGRTHLWSKHGLSGLELPRDRSCNNDSIYRGDLHHAQVSSKYMPLDCYLFVDAVDADSNRIAGRLSECHFFSCADLLIRVAR